MIKHLKRLLASVVLTGSVLFLSISAPSIHNQYLRYTVGDSVVKVLSPLGGGGTGFAVQGASGEHYIMTNEHVCAAAVDDIMYIMRDGDEAELSKVVYRDNKHDLCLLEGNSKYKPLKIADSRPDLGDFHYIVGHPGLRPLTVFSGEYIGEFDYNKYSILSNKDECNGQIIDLDPLSAFFLGIDWVCINQVKAYSSTSFAYRGNSGSPVVTAYGNVIGVLFSGSLEEERNNNLVPLEDIQRVLVQF